MYLWLIVLTLCKTDLRLHFSSHTQHLTQSGAPALRPQTKWKQRDGKGLRKGAGQPCDVALELYQVFWHISSWMMFPQESSPPEHLRSQLSICRSLERKHPLISTSSHWCQLSLAASITCVCCIIHSRESLTACLVGVKTFFYFQMCVQLSICPFHPSFSQHITSELQIPTIRIQWETQHNICNSAVEPRSFLIWSIHHVSYQDCCTTRLERWLIWAFSPMDGCIESELNVSGSPFTANTCRR